MEWTDDFLSYMLLRSDVFFYKIPQQQVLPYIQSALQTGRSAALEINEPTILTLYEQSGISIVYNNQKVANEFGILRAEFEYDRKQNHRVILYSEAIEELENRTGYSKEKVTDILLTHEWFHYLENQTEFIYEKLPSIEETGWLRRKRYFPIRQLSELAAHAFTKEYQQLSVLPILFDIQYLLEKKILTIKEIEEEYKKYQQLYL